MALEKEPFRMYRSEEEIKTDKDKSKTITVRLNAQEQKIVSELMKILNLRMPGTAIKVAMVLGRNVIHSTLGDENMTYLSDPSRRRELLS